MLFRSVHFSGKTDIIRSEAVQRRVHGRKQTGRSRRPNIAPLLAGRGLPWSAARGLAHGLKQRLIRLLLIFAAKGQRAQKGHGPGHVAVAARVPAIPVRPGGLPLWRGRSRGGRRARCA